MELSPLVRKKRLAPTAIVSIAPDVQLVAPDADAIVDAHAVTFEWNSPHTADFILEVARDPEFADPVAVVPSHRSTSVTVYDLFRPDGTQYYWRVSTPSGARSEPHAFIAGTYEEASEQAGAAPIVTGAKALATAVALEAPVPPPYRTGTTSISTAGTIVLVLSLSFILTIGILMFASLGMG